VKRSRLFGSIPLLLALGSVQVGAAEVPLSRASFERAVEEGRSCKRLETSDAYVILKRGTEPVLAALLEHLLEWFTGDTVSDSFVTVRLSTPYTLVRWSACLAKLQGSPFDAEAAWETARTASTVAFQFETKTIVQTHPPLTVATADRYGTEPATVQEAGPRVAEASLRRGEGENATILRAVESAGVESVFPAAALQGSGPLFLVLRTEAPEGRITLKLKPSLLRKP